MVVDPKNGTHFGRISIDVFQDLNGVMFRVTLKSSEITYMDHTANYCKWLNNRKSNFFANYFMENYEKNSNPNFFKCPIRRGFYVILEPREIPTVSGGIAGKRSFLRGNLTITLRFHAKVASKMVFLFESVEVLEFY